MTVDCTAHGACGSVSNHSGIASHARAIADSDAVTSSSPELKCRAGSSRMARKISARSSVPTTSGPSARYSSASFATWARPMSWISWALMSVVVK